MSLDARVRLLEQRFAEVAATRMADVPVCHPALQVAAVGFAPEPGSGGAAGILVSPWFMNLVWFSVDDGAAAAAAVLRSGESRARRIGSEVFDFIGADEAGFGAFETCSLFSPMFEFEDQAAALATAQAVLAQLRAAPLQPAMPARRGFLLGASGA